MKINSIYTSVACNRTPESADWGNNGLILFAACHSVSILDPKYNGNSAKIIRTYNGHKKRVNTVKWIRRDFDENETEFISGSDDGKAIIWNINDTNNTSTAICSGHESGVNVVETIYTKDHLTIATSSSDSTIKIWQKVDNNCECLQTILLKNGFCFALRMTILPTTEQILLAYAGDDDSISLWTEIILNNKREFQPIHQFIGHEDWVRGLDFVTTNENDILLASSSQDNFIRLWKISLRSQEEVSQNEIDLLNIPDGDIHVEENILKINLMEKKTDKLFIAVSIESVLQGHEGWVYGINWHKSDNQIQLLSSSIDKTLIIWNLTEDGVWMENVRVGEVGGNSLGFFGGKFSKNGKSILGHGFQGSFHIWSQSENDDNMWIPDTIVGGHFNEVRDLCWEPHGEFLYSLSADQTTRIHGPWRRPSPDDGSKMEITWHEIARPQVHGYDMQTIAVFSRYKFASGAEEKIVRTFQAPGNFIENFRRISNIENDQEGDELLKTLPKGASVPSLGLSNKAVYNCDEIATKKHVKDEYPENYFVPVITSQPPQEEALMQNTLWPEVQKLYGHGFEIFALISSPDGKLLASSCKASSAEHAQIILWNTTNWKQIQKLASHQLTVTQMKFSPNNKYLISVSRDRKWTLFENKSDNDNFNYQIIARPDKTNGIHSRIIWSCDWSHDSKLFITTSRDGKCVVWGFNEVMEKIESSLGNCFAVAINELAGESITAVAFAPSYYDNIKGEYLIALGLESGKIYLYKFNNKNITQLHCIERRFSHHLTVKKLHFRPCKNQLYLASCGDDHFVRINEIII